MAVLQEGHAPVPGAKLIIIIIILYQECHSQGTALAAILFVIMISDIDENVKKCLIRSFADDTRVNKKIEGERDKELMQMDLEAIYKWAEENKMKFNENKFEQIVHGTLKEVTIDPYETSSGKEMQIKDTVKGLGILATNELKFKEHIEKVTTQCKITMGSLLTQERKNQ